MGDIGFKGQMFAWSNNRSGSERIVERLDRVLANGEWCNRFPRAQCIHGLAVGSDHIPIHLHLDLSDYKGRKHFKFEDMWFDKTECLDVIKKAWTRGGRLREPCDFSYKIRNCQIDLTEWSKASFGNNKKQIDSTRNRLQVISRPVPSESLLVEEKALKSKLHALWRSEEIY